MTLMEKTLNTIAEFKRKHGKNPNTLLINSFYLKELSRGNAFYAPKAEILDELFGLRVIETEDFQICIAVIYDFEPVISEDEPGNDSDEFKKFNADVINVPPLTKGQEESFLRVCDELSKNADLSELNINLENKNFTGIEDEENGKPPVKGVGGLEDEEKPTFFTEEARAEYQMKVADIIADAHLYHVTDNLDEEDEIKYFIAKNPAGALKAWENANYVYCIEDVYELTVRLVQTDFLNIQMNLQTNFGD